MITGWPTPQGREEYAVAFDRGREGRVLVLPAWFDESNKLRRQSIEVMRRLDAAGVDSMLPDLPGWLYAPFGGAQLLRGMLRARTLAAREAGRNETREGLLELGRRDGLELGGHRLGAGMLAALETADVPAQPGQRTITQGEVGGGPLWLRAEPDFDAGQADALAALIKADLA